MQKLTAFETFLITNAHRAGLHDRRNDYPNCPLCHPTEVR